MFGWTTNDWMFSDDDFQRTYWYLNTLICLKLWHIGQTVSLREEAIIVMLLVPSKLGSLSKKHFSSVTQKRVFWGNALWTPSRQMIKKFIFGLPSKKLSSFLLIIFLSDKSKQSKLNKISLDATSLFLNAK